MVGEVLDVMTALARDGMTMIVVTHEMGFARHAAHRVVFMADGQLVEQATPSEFFALPKTGRAREFLSKILTH
jgi:glutamate transport system ATP-binding protein